MYDEVTDIPEAINCPGGTFTLMEKCDGTLKQLLDSDSMTAEELNTKLLPGLKALMDAVRTYDQNPRLKSEQVETYRMHFADIDQEEDETVDDVWGKLEPGSDSTQLDIYMVQDDDTQEIQEIRIYEQGSFTSYLPGEIPESVDDLMDQMSDKNFPVNLMSELNHPQQQGEPLYLYLADLGLNNFLYKTVTVDGQDRFEVVGADFKGAIDKKANISMEQDFLRELRYSDSKYTLTQTTGEGARIGLRSG